MDKSEKKKEKQLKRKLKKEQKAAAAKVSRFLFKKAGITLFLLLLIMNQIQEYILIPVMGKIWSFTLMTTPDGYVSNANALQTILKAPWILPIGAVLVISYILFTIWEVSATFLGIGFAYRGEVIKIVDLLKISAKEMGSEIKPGNWLLALYIALIAPFANIYQASDVFVSYVIPEYIKDFIEATFWLHVIYLLIFAAACYLAYRWFFVLPSFVFGSRRFKDASAESIAYTNKMSFFWEFRRFLQYHFMETIRLSIIPFGLIVGAPFICYVIDHGSSFSSQWYSVIGLDYGVTVAKGISGTLIYLSSTCYLVYAYMEKRGDAKQELIDALPELRRQAKKSRSVFGMEILVSALFACILSGSYLGANTLIKQNEPLFEEIFPKVRIIAHKGYSSEAPENTMPAFEKADRSEYVDYIELDVWSSKDGVPVVLHNESIKAATGLKGMIYDYTYEELQQLPAVYNWPIEEFPDTVIPSLEEVISGYAETTPLVIEIKGYNEDPELPAKIAALMEKYNCEESSMIHSGDYAALKAVKEANPKIRCGLIQAVVTGDCYDLPYADFFSVEHSFVSEQMVDEIHKRGKEIFVWTVNNKKGIRSLSISGVDGFITDYPDDIAQYLTQDVFDQIFKSMEELNSEYEEGFEEFNEGEY